MRGVNKVILVGNLGNDPETRQMPNGGAVTNLSIATTEQWTDKSSGQKQERTEWHRVTMFNRLAEVAAEYLRKGGQVYIEGSLRTDKYQDKQTGQDRWSTSIIAQNMQLLGGRGDGAGGNGTAGGDHASGDQRGQGAPAAAGEPSSRPAAPDWDDEVPF